MGSLTKDQRRPNERDPAMRDDGHKVIAFDADGTLWDSFGVTYEVMLETMKKLGTSAEALEERIGEPYTLDFHTKKISASFTDFFYNILGFTEDDIGIQYGVFREYVLAHATDFKMFDGVHETIRSLHEDLGYTLGVISHNSRPAIVKKLANERTEQGTALSEYFSFVYGFDDMKHPKPHPHTIMDLSILMEHAPSAWMYVGDDLIDVDFARNAGATSVRALYKPYHDGKQHHADYAIYAPTELLQIADRI